jgi:diguanylate cyclase (GGDEF)-like protein
MEIGFLALVLSACQIYLYNDTAGHHAGDRVLVQISTIFRENMGPGDSVIRWGGDEFIFIFHGSNAGKAKMVIERIESRLMTIRLSTALQSVPG